MHIKSVCRFCLFATAFAFWGGSPHSLHAQENAEQGPEPLVVGAAFAEQSSVGRHDPLVLTLSRPLEPDDGEVIVLLGTTDLTAFVDRRDTTLRYAPDLLPLPSGDTDLSVHLVRAGGQWAEVARFPLRVRRAGNIETLAFVPSVTLNNEGQVAEKTVPASGEAFPHRIYQDFSGQLALNGEVSHPSWDVEAQVNVVGASYQEEALRFGERGDAAPLVDLSDYRLHLRGGPANLDIGHFSHGRHPHLMNQFSSRGATMYGDVGGRADLSVAVVNGSQIVGWSDPLGLDEPGHRIVSSTVGVDLLKRASTLRLELSYLDGSVRSRSGFNAGQILDAEKSRGAGAQLAASALNQRIRIEGNVAGSRFTNPNDPELAQGGELVPVEETTRYAHSVDLSIDVLRNIPIASAWPLSFSVGGRRERVDPLYRTVAAYVQADQLQHAANAQFNVGSVALQGSHSRVVDNLDDVPSILTTNSRQSAFAVSLPTASLLGAVGTVGWRAAVLPSLNYGYNWTHQFGTSLPTDGGFDPSHVPDQVSHIHSGSADWQKGLWRFGYRISYALQDNQQVGRTEADFTSLTNSWAMGMTLFRVWDVDLEAGLERAESRESGRVDLTERYRARTTLRPVQGLSLSGAVSPTWTEDRLKTSTRSSTNLSLEATYGFQFWDGPPLPTRAQVFVRYARHSSQVLDRTFDFDTENRTWTVNTGVSLSLF